MRILGIDPGIERTGWGIVDAEGQNFITIDYGCIVTRRDITLPSRLSIIFTKLRELTSEYSPELIAVEQLFFAKNAKTAIDVGQARGVCLLIAGLSSIPLEEATPLQVKSSIVGYGNATKEQVGLMIKGILGLSKLPKPDDVCDALAIAVCAGMKKSFRARLVQENPNIITKRTGHKDK